MKAIDPFGKEFESEKEMTKYYGVNNTTFSTRKRADWTLEECLGIKKHVAVTDPYGKEFGSEAKMAKHYGLSPKVYCCRKLKGWTLKECLGIEEHKSVTAPNGKAYTNYSDMALGYGISQVVYADRKRKGWTIEQCLELEGRGLDVKIRGGIEINELISIGRIDADRQSVTNQIDKRQYYRVTIKETGEIKYMNSDQIKAYPEGWQTLENGKSVVLHDEIGDICGVWDCVNMARKGLKREYSEECEMI